MKLITLVARSRWPLMVGLVLAIAIVVPATGNRATIFFWTTVAITALYAMSVNLLLGQAGIPSFGQAAYFGIGAYAVGLLQPSGMSMLLSLAIGALVAALAALLVAAVSLRSSGLAFSMITLAVAQALYVLTFHVDLFGGENGLPGIFPDRLFGLDLVSDAAALWIFCLVIVVGGIAFLRLLTISPFGRTLAMIREDARRAEFLGIPVLRYQAAAFTVSGALGGLAGGLWALVQTVAVPDYLFWTRSGDPIIMSIIGGIHTFYGPILGAVLYLWTEETLRSLTPAWILWVGLAFLAIVIAAPGGILGLLEEAWARRPGQRSRQGVGSVGQLG